MYAEERGLHAGTLIGWAGKLRDAAAQAEKRSARRPPLFAPVRVVVSRREAGSGEAIEIVLANGRRVRVTGAVEPNVLARVLETAERGAGC